MFRSHLPQLKQTGKRSDSSNMRYDPSNGADRQGARPAFEPDGSERGEVEKRSLSRLNAKLLSSQTHGVRLMPS
jgi:hypothetical protein